MRNLVRVRQRRYTDREKVTALHDLSTKRRSWDQICAELGCSTHTLGEWVRKWSSTTTAARQHFESRALAVAKKETAHLEGSRATSAERQKFLQSTKVMDPVEKTPPPNQVQINVGAFGGYTPPDDDADS